MTEPKFTTATEAPAVAGRLDQPVRRYPLEVECLYTDGTKTLMSKGHQDESAFMAACEEWYGGPLKGWGKVRHGWGRTVPDSTGEYTHLMLPAKPHARGAYPVTTIIDDPAYDHADEDSKTPNDKGNRPALAGPVQRTVVRPVARRSMSMPIRPENRARYPKDWKRIADAIRERAGQRCEGSPAYPDCRAPNGEPHPVTGSRVVLTVAHLDHTPENCDPANLKAMCQRCHLTYDAEHHKRTAYATRMAARGTADLFSA